MRSNQMISVTLLPRSEQKNHQTDRTVCPNRSMVTMLKRPREISHVFLCNRNLQLFILMMCLFVIVVGVTTVASMPVDLFPEVNIPVVVVATSAIPPECPRSRI